MGHLFLCTSIQVHFDDLDLWDELKFDFGIRTLLILFESFLLAGKFAFISNALAPLLIS